MSVDICNDDRFELIAKARDALLERTNIEDSPEEMAVLDSILFRCWQMGWLDRLKECDGVMNEYIVRMPSDMPYEIQAELNAWYVESEPIVRCRDCKYSSHDSRWCYRLPNAEEPPITPDGFCAWGERKVEG